MGKKSKAPSGTWFPRELIMSPAYVDLPKVGLLVLSFVMLKRKMNNSHECVNRNNITMTYKELEAGGVARASVTRGITALVEKGFITIIKPGGAYKRDKAIYGLSELWKHWEKGDSPIAEKIKGRKAVIRVDWHNH